MSFAIYGIGFMIMIIGLIYLAHIMHIPPAYIGAGAVILVGMGILMGVQNTRQKDKAE
jgi:hypothetical protein